MEQCRELFRILDERFVYTGWLWEADDGVGVALWVPRKRPNASWSSAAGEFVWRDPDRRDDRRRRGAVPEVLGLDRGAPAAPNPTGSSVYDLAVAPERRGEGLGAALVELGLGFARRDEVPAFLETARPENVGFYERLGFRVVAAGRRPGDGPRVWFLRFDP